MPFSFSKSSFKKSKKLWIASIVFLLVTCSVLVFNFMESDPYGWDYYWAMDIPPELSKQHSFQIVKRIKSIDGKDVDWSEYKDQELFYEVLVDYYQFQQFPRQEFVMRFFLKDDNFIRYPQSSWELFRINPVERVSVAYGFNRVPRGVISEANMGYGTSSWMSIMGDVDEFSSPNTKYLEGADGSSSRKTIDYLGDEGFEFIEIESELNEKRYVYGMVFIKQPLENWKPCEGACL